jgi:hypothetical protein
MQRTRKTKFPISWSVRMIREIMEKRRNDPTKTLKIVHIESSKGMVFRDVEYYFI